MNLISTIVRVVKRCLMKRQLRSRGIRVGKRVSIIDSVFEKEAHVAEYASVRHSQIGGLTAIGRFAKVDHANIGKYCAISWDVTVGAISHHIDRLTVNAFPYVPYVGNFVEKREQSYQTTVIKNDVWIGCNAVVLPGITIGNGAIVGAGTVVTKDVPDYAIVAGVPARVIRYRFSEEIIERLLALQWWDWPKDVIILFTIEFSCFQVA